MILGLPAVAHAQNRDLYWDANGTATGSGGNGNWDTTSQLWGQSNSDVLGPYQIWNNSALDNAIFGVTAAGTTTTVGTINLVEPITVHNLTFQKVNTWVLSGSTLTLGGTTPTINAISNGTINSILAGTNGLTKTGAAGLTLNGANTFSGGITLSGGALSVANNAAFGDASNGIIVTANASLVAGGASNRTVSIATGAMLTISGAGTAGMLYTGGGSLNVSPNNSLTNDASNYTGMTRLNGQSQGSGSISFTSVRNLGEASSLGAPTTVADGTIQFIGGSQYSDSIVYIGDGDTSNRNWLMSANPARVFVQRGTGTLTLTGDISTTNAAFQAQTADLELLGVISGTGGINFSGSAAGSVTLGGANTFTGVAGVSGGIVRAPVLADGGLASSLGVASSVNLGNLGQLSYTGAGASSNRTWSTSGAVSILNDGSGALTLSGDATVASGTLTFGGGYTGTNTFSGAISGTGTLGSSGNGTWILNGANTRTGTITVSGGTLRAGNASAFGTTTGITTTGGTLDLNGFDMSTTSLTGTGGAVALGGANLALTLGTNVSNVYGGAITGNGTLTKLGAGTLTLTGANSYTGATTLGGGTLALDFSPAGGPVSNILPSTSSLNTSGGVLSVKGAAGEANSQTINGLLITGGNNTISAQSGAGGGVTLNLGTIARTGGLANFVLPAAGAITTANAEGALGGWATVNGSDYAKVLSGNIVAFTPADYVNKDDASTWQTNDIISDAGGAANTPYFGAVTGNAQIGGLQYTAATNSTVTVGTGNTLGVDGTIIVAPSVGGANQVIDGGSMTGTLGGGVLGVQQNGSGTFTISSRIVDNTGVIGFMKSGTGKALLNGPNTYTGATTVAQGTLSVSTITDGGAPSAIGASSNASSNLALQGSTLEYYGGTTTSDRGFTFSRSGAITSDTIFVTSAATNLTLSGAIVSPDGATLVKDGPGTLTLGGANNSYTGGTTVNAGTLAVATLANGGVSSTIGASSNASSNLTLQGGGALQYTGVTGATDRGFTLATSGGRIDVAQGTTTLTVSGSAVGTGGFTKSGAGILVLSGANTYAGGNRVTAGTLRAGSTTAFGATNNLMTVDPGATLDLAGISNTVGALGGAGSVTLGSATLTAVGNNGTFSGTISGPGGFTKGNGFTQTFVGCNNTYTGVTTIQGVLIVDCLANGGAASGIGASSSASSSLVFQGSMLRYTGGTVTTDRGFTLLSTGQIDVNTAGTTLTFTGTVTGAGQLQKYGPGTLILSGDNNNTGGVNVQAGILKAGSPTAFGTGSYTLANVAGAVLDLNGYNMSTNVLSGGGAAGGNIQLGSGTLTLTGGTATYAGLITGTGGLIKSGGGTQVLSGCDSNYTGGTSVTGGVLQVQCLTNGGTNSSIGASSNAAGNLVVNNGVLTYAGTGDSTDRLMTIGGTAQILSSGTGAVNFTNNGAIAFANPNTAQIVRLGGTYLGDNRFGLRLDNNGAGVTSFIKQDGGTWILTNSASSYTGTTQILGGVLGVDKLSNGGTGSSIGAASNAATNLVIGSGATLRYTGGGDSTDRRFTLAVGTTFIESTGTGAVNFTNNGAVSYTGTGARVMALGGTNAGDNIMGATIGDQNAANITSLAKNDSGKWILTGTNTYTGATNVNAGTLVIGNGGTAGSIVSGVINDYGVLGFNRSDTLTIGGNILGLGSVQQLGTGTTVLTGTSNYTGGTTIALGALQLGNGGTTGSIVGDVVDNGTLTFNRSNGYSFDGAISGTGAVRQIGGGTTILTGANSYQGGTTIAAGTLQVSSDANLGAASGGLAFTGGTLNTTASFTSGRATSLTGTGTIATNAGTTLTLTGAISGAGALTKAGTGTLILAADNSYAGLTTISAGTLQIGDGGATGGISGNVLNNGALVFNRSGTLAMGGTIIGGGSVTQSGPGTTILTGANSYAGATSVNVGTLLVNGDQSGATGLTSVASGATLGGAGTIGGNVTLADGGTLAAGGNGVGTLTVNGNLALANATQLNFEFGKPNVPGGPLNDLVNVGGNLTLDGVINVTQAAGGGFGPGVYRIFNYAGGLTDNGLTIGAMPAGSDVFVQTAIAGQVNLANTAGLTLNFWDGAGQPKNDGAIQGGNGTWRLADGQINWTEVSGLINADYAQDSFAIFQGTAGTVTVDNGGGNVLTAGMQFTTNGYRIAGAPLTLTGTDALIRTGDGGAADAGITATITAQLTGSARLVKDLAGTLILAGANSYTGGTAINGGTLAISSDANLGDAAGGLGLNGGVLETTTTFASSRAVDLAGAGTFLTDDGTRLTLNGVVSGAGALIKDGGGTLVLTANDSYAGGTTITAGTLQIGAGGTGGAIVGDVANNGALLFNRSDSLTFGGAITGGGAVGQIGSGTTILTGDSSYTGGTTITAGMLQLGNGGATGGIVGDVANDGALVFDRSNTLTFAGLISGAGRVEQAGGGTTILTGANSYAGATTVSGGTLLVNGDQSAATGLTSVGSGATIGGTGTIGGDVAIANGGILAPGDATGPGTLTINGNLGLSGGTALNYDFGRSNVVGGPLNDLTNVAGNLTLDGTINVTTSSGGSFDPGIYRVISYGGALNNQGLAIGAIPSGTDFYVQTSVQHQVNLINTNGLALRFWDGASGGRNDGIITGGDGVWQNMLGNDNWTLDDASINAPFLDSAFAIFSGAPGMVSIDEGLGAVRAIGLQFASDGYTIMGQNLTLIGPQSVIRVGDGSSLGLGYTATINSAIVGASELVKTDIGTLVLTGANSYAGGTRIEAGTLRISSDANLGDAGGALTLDGGTLETTTSIGLNRAIDLPSTGTFLTGAGTALTLNGAASGAGGFTKAGAGDLILTGANSFGGDVDVTAGGLFVNGDQSAATGLISVAAGATLGGAGTIGGDVAIADGGILAPGTHGVGTLAINGSLALSAGSRLSYQFGAPNVAGGPLNDLVNVGGDLTLAGTIDVSVPASGNFGPGVYRVFNYGGALTDNGLALGAMPGGSEVSVQTAVAGQVNLVNTAGLTLNFWDGGAGVKNDSTITGGDGVWRAGGKANNWTEMNGQVNADYALGAFAIFSASPGTVTVDNSGGTVLAAGMQFASSGYTITGDTLTLTGTQAIVQVGDGSAAGADYTATIDAALTGSTGVVKTDAGTLILTGTNSYAGGTALNGGIVRVANDANLGAATGKLSLDGGTLNTSATFASSRTIDLAGAGGFRTDDGTTLTLNGAVSGVGGLVKSGAGTLVLAGTGSQAGATNVSAGTLLVNGDFSAATGPTSVAAGASLGGTGTIGGNVTMEDGATLTPGAGSVGTLAVAGNLSLAAGATLAYELGQANSAGGSLNDLVNVGGDLVLGGTINVTVPAGGAFDVGIYRVFNYGGALTDNGLTLGGMPAGSDVSVQTSIAGQVNLVNAGDLALNFWNGAAGPKNNGVIEGGDGVWRTGTNNDNWTNASGTLNAPYSNGAFAIFSGTGGKVTVDNGPGQVAASGMQFAADGYVIAGDTIALTGPQSVIRVGDGSTAGAGITATINAPLSGGTRLVKTDAGTLVLGGANSYTGGTAINGGTVRIASDANLGSANGGVTLDSGTLATSASLGSARDIVMASAGALSPAADTTFTFNGLLSGTGALTKAGAGTLLITGDNGGYVATTTVTAGTLAVTGKLGGAVTVDGGGRLEGTGSVGDVANAGTVAPGRDGFGALTVNGGYASTGGTLAIRAALGGDGSPADRLVVTNGTSGTTQVVVTNRGGLGGRTVEGIKIVDVTGGASAGTFTLKGDYSFEGSPAVIAGAYGYRLFQGGTSTPSDGDWYLRSSLLDPPNSPLYQPGVPVYEAYGMNLLSLNDLPTLQQRVGNRSWASGANAEGSGIWGRMEGTRTRANAALSTSGTDQDVNDWSIQLGTDRVLAGTDKGERLVAGLTAHYGKADSNVRSIFGNGSIKTDGYGAGATLTWYGLQGFYIDGQTQFSRFDSDLNSSSLGKLVRGNDGRGEAYSLEVGKRTSIATKLSITPQTQMVYSHVRFDRFTDPFGATVTANRGDSLRSRWGISLDYQDEHDEARAHVYGLINLNYEWLDGTRADVSGVGFDRANQRLWGELGLGASISLKNGITLYGEASGNSAIRDFGNSYRLKANVGARLAF